MKSKSITLLLILALICFLYRYLHVSSDGITNIMRASQFTSGSYGKPVEIGKIDDSALQEISGLTPSRTGNGLWWVHNDSGDQPRIYAINSSGKLLGRYTVTGARNRDWEDMAGFTAGNGKPMLYLADIGDNQRKRDDLTLYRIKEPDLSKGVRDGKTEPAVPLPFRYPDGHHDAEALFVDPQNGRPYIVTKTFSPPCGIYRFPLPLRPNVKVTLEKVEKTEGAAVDRITGLMLVTGAATSPDGNHVVVRNYLTAYEMARTRGGAFETIFKSEPKEVPLALDRQGEAISYTRDGKSIVTTSEKTPAPIHKIDIRRTTSSQK